jgi:phage-related tail fiber protein
LDTGTVWQPLAQLMPSGVIQAFGGNAAAPPGWLLCVGSAVSRTTYASLFAAIGTAFGSGDGSTTFNLPDLRGQFLRGVDAGAGRDPNSGTRTAMASGGNTGDNAGSVQASATAVPVAPFTNGYPGGNTGSPTPTDSGFVFTSSQGSGSKGSDWGRAAATNSLPAQQNVAGGDSETRPTNAYVQFIIKI